MLDTGQGCLLFAQRGFGADIEILVIDEPRQTGDLKMVMAGRDATENVIEVGHSMRSVTGSESGGGNESGNGNGNEYVTAGVVVGIGWSNDTSVAKTQTLVTQQASTARWYGSRRLSMTQPQSGRLCLQKEHSGWKMKSMTLEGSFQW
jgi:hypothetical protein